VAAGDADVIDATAASASKHAAKSYPAHSHAGHRTLAQLVRDEYENSNRRDYAEKRTSKQHAEKPSQSEAYSKRHHYPCHLLTYPVQTMIIGIVLLLSFPTATP